jgi:hypothetical protein
MQHESAESSKSSIIQRQQFQVGKGISMTAESSQCQFMPANVAQVSQGSSTPSSMRYKLAKAAQVSSMQHKFGDGSIGQLESSKSSISQRQQFKLAKN